MKKASGLIIVAALITTQPSFAFNSALLNQVNKTADQVCGTVIKQGSYHEESLSVKVDGLTPEMVQQLKSQYSLPDLLVENGAVVIKRRSKRGMKQEDALKNNMEVRRCRQTVAQMMIRNQH